MMQKSFGEKSGIMLDFAQYMVIAEENAAQHFPAFARNHILFNEDMRVYSDSTLSRTFAEVTKDQIIDFLDSWNEKQDHESRIYVSYDSTNKNTQAGDIDFAEFGHAKDDPKTPIVNIGVGYDTNNRVPLFYETYPGSIPDVNQLKHMIEKAENYHYKNIGIILDRGYFSKSNIEYMDEKGYQFLMMVKGCKPLVSELIKDNYGTFEDNRKYIIGDTGLHGITIQRHLYEGDQKMRYFHLVFSPEKCWLRDKSLNVSSSLWLWSCKRLSKLTRKLVNRTQNISIVAFAPSRGLTAKKRRFSCMPLKIPKLLQSDFGSAATSV